ncbi:MAG: hypothetical protein NVSMB14_15300 [Isosphaeraceae bacterium]
MADDKNLDAPKGSGPLGKSGVEPSGTVRRNYQSEFVEPRRPRPDSRPQVPVSPKNPEPKSDR